MNLPTSVAERVKSSFLTFLSMRIRRRSEVSVREYVTQNGLYGPNHLTLKDSSHSFHGATPT